MTERGAAVQLVLGADIGGTSTRVAVLGQDGSIRGFARAAGGNLRSSTPDQARDRLATALAQAWSQSGVDALTTAHLGIAGAGSAGRQAAEQVVRQAWAEAGLPVTALAVGDDLTTAFAAGAEGADGTLLLAGTGAVACRISDGEVVARADGLGWLLGDTGSGVWFGLAALRAAAAELDRTGPATRLTPEVLAALGVSGSDPRQELIAAAHAVPVAAHGGLAPLVMAAARTGDPVATRLVEQGVAALLRTATAVHVPSSQVVLAGSLLIEDTPVRTGVRAGLTGPVRDAPVPLVGALRLAARAAGWPEPDRSELVRAVTGRS